MDLASQNGITKKCRIRDNAKKIDFPGEFLSVLVDDPVVSDDGEVLLVLGDVGDAEADGCQYL